MATTEIEAEPMPQEFSSSRQPQLVIGTAGYMLLDVAVLAAGFAAFGNELPPFGALLVAFIVGQLGG